MHPLFDNGCKCYLIPWKMRLLIVQIAAFLIFVAMIVHIYDIIKVKIPKRLYIFTLFTMFCGLCHSICICFLVQYSLDISDHCTLIGRTSHFFLPVSRISLFWFYYQRMKFVHKNLFDNNRCMDIFIYFLLFLGFIFLICYMLAPWSSDPNHKIIQSHDHFCGLPKYQFQKYEIQFIGGVYDMILHIFISYLYFSPLCKATFLESKELKKFIRKHAILYAINLVAYAGLMFMANPFIHMTHIQMTFVPFVNVISIFCVLYMFRPDISCCSSTSTTTSDEKQDEMEIVVYPQQN